MPSKASLPWFGDMGIMNFFTVRGEILLTVKQKQREMRHFLRLHLRYGVMMMRSPAGAALA